MVVAVTSMMQRVLFLPMVLVLLLLPYSGASGHHLPDPVPQPTRAVHERERQFAEAGHTLDRRSPLNITVNTPADTLDVNLNDNLCADISGNCSLRAAVMQANQNPGSIITVPAGVYVLTRIGTNEDVATTGDLDILASTTIIGAGVGQTIIDGAGADRLFDVQGVNFNLRAVTLRNGAVSPPPDAGPGDPMPPGGAIWVSTVGGFPAAATIEEVLIESSSATYGGGISVEGSGTQLTLRRSAIVGTSAVLGGGIDIYAADQVNLENVTISGASADYGGGVSLEATTLTILSLNNTTIAYNQADISGGGIYNQYGVVNMSNTIAAGNRFGGALSDCFGTVNTTGTNLFSSVSGCILSINVDRVVPAHGLKPLNMNLPGSTPTHALSPNSPAVDAVDVMGCLATDQRGVERPQGANCDIGAYELRDEDKDLPLAFALFTPSDNAVYSAASEIQRFTWKPSTFAVQYTLTIAANSAPDQVRYSASGSAHELCSDVLCSLTPDVVLDSSSYLWNVIAENGGGSTPATAPHSLMINDQVINLLMNGGFEQNGVVNGRRMPEEWQGLQLHQLDRVQPDLIGRPDKPDKQFAYEGSYSFRFAGASDRNRRIKQVLRPENSDIDLVSPGDTLIVRAFALGRQVPVDARIIVRVIYTTPDPARPNRALRTKALDVMLPSGSYFDYHRPVEAQAVIPTQVRGIPVSEIRRVVVVLRYKKASKGRLFVDSMSLLAVPASGAGDVIPLPSSVAEAEFSGLPSR
jgi:hypothetical protein